MADDEKRSGGDRRSSECDHCVRDQVESLVPVIYKMVGEVKANACLNVVVIILGVLFTWAAYSGKSVMAGDIKVNTKHIADIQETRKKEAKETKEYREFVTDWMGRTNLTLKAIEKKLE